MLASKTVIWWRIGRHTDGIQWNLPMLQHSSCRRTTPRQVQDFLNPLPPSVRVGTSIKTINHQKNNNKKLITHYSMKRQEFQTASNQGNPKRSKIINNNEVSIIMASASVLGFGARAPTKVRRAHQYFLRIRNFKLILTSVHEAPRSLVQSFF